jgi:methylenetetrahydrofolate dehydrogenase (NADP+)/methenyltetrahydrofolate cyclohydrolase
LTRTDDGIKGDVDPGAAAVAGYLTPMPGGTGPMTIAMLLRNTLAAVRFLNGDVAYPSF